MVLFLRSGFIFFLFFSTLHSFSQTPVSLQCEYLQNPIGIDAAHPRFSWRLQDTRAGARQSSFQIVVGTDSTAVSTGKGDCWMADGNAQLCHYQGTALLPFTRYY